MSTYFVVLKGKTGPEIYNNWEECKNNILGVSNIQYKKFKSIKDAKKYISLHLKSKKYLETKNYSKTKSNIIDTIWICGSCITYKGKILGGIGVYFGKDSTKIISDSFNFENPTKNRTELLAAIRGIDASDSLKPLEIKTTSKYIISCVGKYNYMNLIGEKYLLIENGDLIKMLFDVLKKRILLTYWTQVDRDDIRFADLLSKNGIIIN